MKNIVLFLLFCSCYAAAGQQTQTVKGYVADHDTRLPLAGATVQLANTHPPVGTQTDEHGFFELATVPLGRQIVQVSYLGYQPFATEPFVVGSVKEVVIQVVLRPAAVTTGEVTVSAVRAINEALNPSSVVSTRSFSVEETERIPASVFDPGRMALTFPGVQQGRDDTENDIIIRGNSSFGMLWRLEGIDVPNPNHFARPGTSGGGISIFSAQLLSRSDFSTGGMPAEYGNAISGAFDIHFRKGNKTLREHRVRVGLLGLDFATEGPIRKGRSSYLVNYRYSTLGLLNKMGIYPVAERVSNDFQDLSFNLSFDSKNNQSFWTIFGISGLSLEHYQPVADPAERQYSRPDHWEDRYQGSNMAAVGATFTHTIDEQSFVKIVAAAMGSDIFRRYDTLNLNDTPYRYNTQQYFDYRLSVSATYHRKLATHTRLKVGAIGHQIFYDFFKQTSPRSASSDINQVFNLVSVEGGGATQTGQFYTQLTHQWGERWTANVGAHLLYLHLNRTAHLDPRLSVRYQPHPRHTLSLAYGLHSQMLPLAAYYFAVQDTTVINGVPQVTELLPNFELAFVKSHHLIGAWNYTTDKMLRLTAEAYLQRLYDIPVRPIAADLYWMLNEQQEFPEFEVVNEGKGLNYGIDLAAEKLFANGMYFLLTHSQFKSLYETWDKQVYHSRYSTQFASSYTVGKEFTFRNNGVLQIGARVLYNGGFRYTPHDPILSAQAGVYVMDSNRIWGEQVKPYFRIDSRIAYRFNRPRLAMNFALDMQNVTNHPNPNNVGYDPATNALYFRNHPSGFIPVLTMTADF